MKLYQYTLIIGALMPTHAMAVATLNPCIGYTLGQSCNSSTVSMGATGTLINDCDKGINCTIQTDGKECYCAAPNTYCATTVPQCGTANSNHIITCTQTNTNCSTTTTYKCDANYWGSPTNATSTTACTQCDAADFYTDAALKNRARGTCPAGSTAKTACQIESGTYYDSHGTFTLTSTCSYTN